MENNMELKEAKEILNKAGFLMENYDEELKNAIEVQVGSFWKNTMIELCQMKKWCNS